MSSPVLEACLVDQCAPTLARLKTGSLFNLPLAGVPSPEAAIDAARPQLEAKGLSITILKKRKDSALLYLYREKNLREDLSRPGVADFLARYGYTHTDVQRAVSTLRERFSDYDEFPHEIGLFIGYPFEDVVGFIQNKGKNAKCTGTWKVYGDQTVAERQFARFRKCREVYTDSFRRGRSLDDLIVTS